MTMPTEKAIKNFIYDKGREFEVPVAAVSNGVDLSHFKPGRAPAEIYAKYNIPSNRPVVLYVGRVDPEKKVGLVVEAFSKMLGTWQGDVLPLLLVVGDGVDKNRLIKKIHDIGISEAVRFLGKVLPPDLYELYKVGDVFATASTIETQGIVLIEAAACGLPLIAVDAGAVSEVCIDGENGFLCEPGNVDEISAAMLKILSDTDLRDKFSRESVTIASEHNFERTLDKFINIYERVIKDKKN